MFLQYLIAQRAKHTSTWEFCKLNTPVNLAKVYYLDSSSISTVVSHIYAYDRMKTLSFILLIRRKSTEFENESNV